MATQDDASGEPIPQRPEPHSHFSSDSWPRPTPRGTADGDDGAPKKKRSWRLSRSSRQNEDARTSVPSSHHNPSNGTLHGHPHPARHFTTHRSTNTAPLPFFHPTHAELHPTIHSGAQDGKAPSEWSSRASRKNRYAPGAVHVSHSPGTPPVTDAEKTGVARDAVLVAQRVRHPHTKLKVHLAWDISFWVAIVFVLGSTAWVVNGFYLFLPLLNEASDHQTAAAWWAFAGGTLFEVGSYLMLVESLNTGHENLFGPALWNLIDKPAHDYALGSTETLDAAGPNAPWGPGRFRWIGLNSWRDIGFLASYIQMYAATIFWVSTITGLPGVIHDFPDDPPTAITDVFFWTPQVIGGWGFIVASSLLMLETQKAWWRPALKSLGWHIGLWNLIGAVGFMLCGALGYASLVSTKVNYQSVLCTFWGGWAFLIGSVIQLWETLWREDPNAGDGDSGSPE
ncbi:hypothetical protein PUNSTDRAFT_146307 [Punctularia strigosozonata HHB-11173 SS5]|uniref:Integral membrane protein n=1 Tax=Punctularia strigosozonata (strain HHB-11173) TaxID=741275 RepID=R7S5F9_PUNST|nr:uncharacterized protein PUNSTDRAFT_146307 [Punctularia strigosozonata HHB-11173 SS5]EIN04636.1 hypothetical protein PUNSTDRAFT_146307 [Punctularia strigosozonata HHB-11173 SS5]